MTAEFHFLTETHKTNFNPDSIISLWKYTLMNVMLIT